MHLLPFPHQLIPFEPVDGPDNVYGQMYQPIQRDPYKAVSIKGLILLCPCLQTLIIATILALCTSQPSTN